MCHSYYYMPVTNKTKLTRANTSKSLRTTVPAQIIQQLKLEEGDSVEWVLRPVGSKFEIVLVFGS